MSPPAGAGAAGPSRAAGLHLYRLVVLGDEGQGVAPPPPGEHVLARVTRLTDALDRTVLASTGLLLGERLNPGQERALREVSVPRSLGGSLRVAVVYSGEVPADEAGVAACRAMLACAGAGAPLDLGDRVPALEVLSALDPLLPGADPPPGPPPAGPAGLRGLCVVAGDEEGGTWGVDWGTARAVALEMARLRTHVVRHRKEGGRHAGAFEGGGPLAAYAPLLPPEGSPGAHLHASVATSADPRRRQDMWVVYEAPGGGDVAAAPFGPKAWAQALHGRPPRRASLLTAQSLPAASLVRVCSAGVLSVSGAVPGLLHEVEALGQAEGLRRHLSDGLGVPRPPGAALLRRASTMSAARLAAGAARCSDMKTLAWLGDAVLDVTVAANVWAAMRDESVGAIFDAKTRVVEDRSWEAAAREHGLAPFMAWQTPPSGSALPGGEPPPSPKLRSKNYATHFEALAASLFLAAGHSGVAGFLRRCGVLPVRAPVPGGFEEGELVTLRGRGLPAAVADEEWDGGGGDGDAGDGDAGDGGAPLAYRELEGAPGAEVAGALANGGSGWFEEGAGEAKNAWAEECLGYRFRDVRWLREAMTHPTVSGGAGRGLRSNARLKFLGSEVAQWLLAARLVREEGLLVEGALSARYQDAGANWLAHEGFVGVAAGMDEHVAVREEPVFAGVREFGRAARGGEWAGGEGAAKGWQSALSECVEAVLGAVLVDSGWDVDEVERCWEHMVARASAEGIVRRSGGSLSYVALP